jgi:hypothetical protein
MLTIFADNTMILGSIAADRQDAAVATSSITRGFERLAARLMRAVVPVRVVAHAYCANHPASSCPRMNSKRWQLGLSGKSSLGQGQPVGSGINAG